MKTTILNCLILSFASLLLADDFKTTDGKEYKNVTVTNEEPDGITVTNTKAGLIAKLPFAKLPKDVQERFHYDPEKAAASLAQQNAGGAQRQNIQDLEARQTSLQNQEYAILQEIGRAEEAKENEKRMRDRRPWKDDQQISKMSSLAAQLPSLHKALDEVRAQTNDVKRQLDKARQPQPQNNVEALNARYSELLRKEDDLMGQIAEGEVGQYRAIPNAEQHAQLPSLHSQLDEVRREKDQVKQQIDQAQR